MKTNEELLKILPPPCLSDEFEPGNMWRIDELLPYIQRLIIEAELQGLRFNGGYLRNVDRIEELNEQLKDTL